jgi:hypothetical protein
MQGEAAYWHRMRLCSWWVEDSEGGLATQLLALVCVPPVPASKHLRMPRHSKPFCLLAVGRPVGMAVLPRVIVTPPPYLTRAV